MRTLNWKVYRIRRKKNIKVLFVVAEAATWKNDSLYQAMLVHPRFTPMILVVPDEQKKSLSKEGVDLCFDFFNKKGYSCIYPYKNNGKYINLQKVINPDIIFYQKPYLDYPKKFLFYYNMRSLFCYTGYAFHSLLTDWANDNDFFNVLWQNYYENDSSSVDLQQKYLNLSRSLVVTGLPLTDLFLNNKHEYQWKKADVKYKKIIWAPHYSIANSWLDYSTFLSIADDMLHFVTNTKLPIQFVFKPHPLLKSQLYDYPSWGKERTDWYYSQWDNLLNAQLETGEYVDLFMTSDAMIHDCGSFTIEYLHTLRPVMFILKDNDEEEHTKMMNTFARKAFDLHYKGRNIQDIQEFILGIVLNGVDSFLEERKNFVEKFLLPPNGKSAADNIILSILGIGYYNDKK